MLEALAHEFVDRDFFPSREFLVTSRMTHIFIYYYLISRYSRGSVEDIEYLVLSFYS